MRALQLFEVVLQQLVDSLVKLVAVIAPVGRVKIFPCFRHSIFERDGLQVAHVLEPACEGKVSAEDHVLVLQDLDL